jgi:hypothetical protein
MAFDFNSAALTDSLAFLATTFPVNSVLEIRSGSSPGVANAATGTLLVTYTLGASPWATASAASRSLASLPLTTTASGGGAGTDAGHFRLRNAADDRRVDGSITATGGGGDMTLDNISIATGQTVNITAFSVGATDNQP